jgi:hypothetical protein
MGHSIDWNAAGGWILTHLRDVAETIGVTGFGIGFVKFLRHVPAPKKTSVWSGCLFDTFQDLASNDSRIGERRKDGGEAGNARDAMLPEIPPADSRRTEAEAVGPA